MASGNWMTETWVEVVALAKRGGYCLNNVDAFEECRPFWAALMYVLIAVAVIVALIIFSHFISYRLKRRAVMRRRELELEVASEEVMQELRWSGESSLDTEMSSAQIARRIREEKERLKKADARESTDTSKGDRNMGIDILHR